MGISNCFCLIDLVDLATLGSTSSSLIVITGKSPVKRSQARWWETKLSLKGFLVKRYLYTVLASAVLVGITYFLPYGTWAELNGLPAHPLIVHSVVVLLPIVAIFLLVSLYKKELIRKYHLYLVGILGLVTIGVIAAKSSGDSLSAAVGLPKLHAEWGNNLVPLAMALFVAFSALAFFSVYKKIAVISKVMTFVVGLLSVASLGMTYVVGHSGAESVWKNKYQESKKAITTESRLISREEVRLHNVSTDCWTIVGKGVYDVTSFVERHPAGSPAIKEMCGKNASEDYLSEHSGQAEPEKWLSTLKIGDLKD